MKPSHLYRKVLEKVGLKSPLVPVLCHNCGKMVGVKRSQIQFIELDSSPCCGAIVSPPPENTKPGKVWDEFGGERIRGNGNPKADIDPGDIMDSLSNINGKHR